MKNIKKVVVIGPESTGKSTLCSSLAAHYNTLWCAEYAREYLTQNGKEYRYHDLLQIAKGQLSLEDKTTAAAYAEGKDLLFIDTDMYVMKVWCEYAYNRCHAYILEQIAERKYDLYLLCNTDLPWTPDELREYPNTEVRQELYCLYHDILVQQRVPFAMVQGVRTQRVSTAVEAIEKLLLR